MILRYCKHTLRLSYQHHIHHLSLMAAWRDMEWSVWDYGPMQQQMWTRKRPFVSAAAAAAAYWKELA
jgi:hypothetical protein